MLLYIFIIFYIILFLFLISGLEMVGFELASVLMEDRKNSDNIQKATRGICEKWKIHKEQVEAAIIDGGRNIKNAVKREFGDEKHVGCFAHLIDNIGQMVIGNKNHAVPPSERDEPLPDVPENEDDIPEEDVNGEILPEFRGTIREILVKVKKSCASSGKARSPLHGFAFCSAGSMRKSQRKGRSSTPRHIPVTPRIWKVQSAQNFLWP